MKKTVIYILLLCMILPLCACTVVSPAYATYGKYQIKRNMYEYWIGYYKAAMIAEYGIDESKYDESVWEQSIDGNTTLANNITEHVDSLINEMLVCAELFDQLGLSKDANVKKQINDVVDNRISGDVKAASSLPELNAMLGNYKMNRDALREAYEFEAKASVVSNKLFGEGGEYAVTDGEREQYYQENFHRVRHILINNIEKYVYNDKGEPKIDIYTGNYVTEELSAEEKEEKQKLAEDIYKRCEDGEDFEALFKEYNEDSGMNVYKDGYFISADSYYYFDTVYLAAALTLKPGEINLIQTSDGLVIIKEYPLEAGMWSSEINAVFFADMDDNIISQKKPEIFKEKYSKIIRDEEYVSAFDFSNVVPLDSRLIYSEE